MKTADLHFHSLHSDGKHSVDWVSAQLKEARKQGLELAVLTDHDGVGGFADFASQVSDWWKPICASELSCTFQETESSAAIELHLLVYGIDPHDQEICDDFKRFREEREKRFYKICERLNAAGIRVDANAIAAKHGGVLGRPHVADALVEAGAARDRSDAFDRYLKDGSPFSVPKWRFPLKDAVDYSKRHGCKTSIAHPGQYGFEEPLLKKFRELGVDAIEIYHPRHDSVQTEHYRRLAQRLGYKVSGGSDFHSLECDHEHHIARLGRTQYPISEAKDFLGELLD